MAITEVLKFDGHSSIFAWKHPNSELNSWTQLIVNESQEAIFVKNGQIADVFGPGRYKLSSDNLPILQKIVNLPFGGKSPFSAEVWFINKAFSLDIKWGTTTPIQIQDPKYNVFIPLRAFGQFGIQVNDSKRFLVKLVGTMKFFNADTLNNYFKGLFVTRVKDYISSCLIKSKISMLEINAHLNEISDSIRAQVEETLEEYGISIVSFYVNDINVPENDPAVKQLKAALAKRAEMDIIGYNYQQERTFDTLETAADNKGVAGSVMGGGIGLGMGFGLGEAMASQTRSMTKSMDVEETIICESCHSKISAKSKRCPECGADPNEKPNKLSCASCGSAISENTKFCPNCGAKIVVCPECGADMGDKDSCPKCGAKKCSKCGSVVKKDTKFCPECGNTFEKLCPKCGAKVSSNMKFCSECGQILS